MSAPHQSRRVDDLDLRGLVLRRETLLAAALLLLLGAIALRFPAFVTASSLGGVFNDSAILIIMALGQAAVLLTRSVDLSVAANVALTGMAVALIDAHHGLPLGLTILAAPALGLVLGALTASSCGGSGCRRSW